MASPPFIRRRHLWTAAVAAAALMAAAAWPPVAQASGKPPVRHHRPAAAVAVSAPVPSATPDAGPAPAATTTPADPVPTLVPAGRVVTLGVGRALLLDLTAGSGPAHSALRLADVFVGDARVADVHVRSASAIYVLGRAPGETTIYASDTHGAIVWSATVRVGGNLDNLEPMLARALPESGIAVANYNGAVLLTGTVHTPEDAAEAERLARGLLGDKTPVLSRLRVATPLQVTLQVRFAEVSRRLIRSIGVNWASSTGGSSGVRFGIGSGTAISQYNPGGQLMAAPASPVTTNTLVTPPASGTVLGIGATFGALDLLSALDLAETIGLSTTLAEPNLTAISGETAQFLAGGEFPIPVSNGLGTTSIDYKKYGVSLSYTPTVLAGGRISLKVRPEVSELTSQGGVTLNGYAIPGLTVRRAETTIELGSGQSFMIAGLLNNTSQNTITKLPGAGDVPILGSLFRSTAYQRGETELVIVVTPWLVRPVDAGAIHLPTDGFRAADAVEQLVAGRDTSGAEITPSPPAASAGKQPAAGASSPTTPRSPPAPVAPVPALAPADHAPASSSPAPGFTQP